MLRKNARGFEPWYIEEYNKGAKARMLGKKVNDNPHPVLTGKHHAWLAGYMEQD